MSQSDGYQKYNKYLKVIRHEGTVEVMVNRSSYLLVVRAPSLLVLVLVSPQAFSQLWEVKKTVLVSQER